MDEMRVNIDYEAERLNGEEKHLDLGSRSTMVYETTNAVDMTMATAKLSMADIDYYVRIDASGKMMAYAPNEYAFEATEHIRGRELDIAIRNDPLESRDDDRQVGEDMHRNFGKWSTAIMENGTSHQVNEAQMGLDAAKIDSYIRITEDGKHSLHVPTEYLGDAQKALARDLDRTLEMTPVSAMGRSR